MLVRVRKEGVEGGLAKFFRGEEGVKGKDGTAALEVFGRDGLPPLPSGLSLKPGADKYALTPENAYPEQ